MNAGDVRRCFMKKIMDRGKTNPKDGHMSQTNTGAEILR